MATTLLTPSQAAEHLTITSASHGPEQRIANKHLLTHSVNLT